MFRIKGYCKQDETCPIEGIVKCSLQYKRILFGDKIVL